MTPHDVTDYFATLAALPGRVEVHDRTGAVVDLPDFYGKVIRWCRSTHDDGNTIHLIGNAVGAMKVATVGHRQSVEKVPLIKYITALLR